MAVTPKAVIALDVGAKRIGVAVASLAARLPRPLITLANDETFYPALQRIITEEAAGALVVGLPRGLQGQHTGQTAVIEGFAADLRRRFALPIVFQDEALTSQHAETELESRGRPYHKADVDALAATYILDDFLADHHDLRDPAELAA